MNRFSTSSLTPLMQIPGLLEAYDVPLHRLNRKRIDGSNLWISCTPRVSRSLPTESDKFHYTLSVFVCLIKYLKYFLCGMCSNIPICTPHTQKILFRILFPIPKKRYHFSINNLKLLESSPFPILRNGNVAPGNFLNRLVYFS